MNIEDILSLVEKPAQLIDELKSGRNTSLPDITKHQDAINPLAHEIFNQAIRPDKLVVADDGRTTTEPVARIALALQKLIVRRASSFLFGNPVEIMLQSEEAAHKKVYDALIKILEDVKIKSANRRIARILFSCTEVAELWYPVSNETEDNLYGIGSKFKLKMKILNPLKGDVLYPYFDEYGDLIAFSREYAVVKKENKQTILEVYTDKFLMKFDTSDGEPVMMEGFPKENPIGKIPVVYANQDQADYEDVQLLIERLEKLLSNFADTNDYHASPKIFVKGQIKGFAKKGESGAIIEGTENSTAEYLSWQHAPESVKLEIETMLRMIYTITQTPDISFDSVKGLGAGISGKALRMMFLDAHLKVQDKMEIFDEYLQRRLSVINAFLVSFNKELAGSIKTIKLESVVTPFMIDDESDKLDIIMTATGNKPVLSQKSGVRLAGYATDADEEYEQIKSEEKDTFNFELFPTAE